MNRSEFKSTRSTDLQVAEDIVPIAELKSHLSEVVRGLRGRGRPLIVTQNGKAAAVVLSPEAFDRLAYRARFVEAVAEGLEDVEAGRVHGHDEVGRIMDERFGKPPKPKKR